MVNIKSHAMDNALDSVSHQMSGKACDDYVTSAIRSLIVDKMLDNALHPM